MAEVSRGRDRDLLLASALRCLSREAPERAHSFRRKILSELGHQRLVHIESNWDSILPGVPRVEDDVAQLQFVTLYQVLIEKRTPEETRRLFDAIQSHSRDLIRLTEQIHALPPADITRYDGDRVALHRDLRRATRRLFSELSPYLRDGEQEFMREFDRLVEPGSFGFETREESFLWDPAGHLGGMMPNPHLRDRGSVSLFTSIYGSLDRGRSTAELQKMFTVFEGCFAESTRRGESIEMRTRKSILAIDSLLTPDERARIRAWAPDSTQAD